MKNGLYKKGLVIGIIFFFICVAFQPSIASVIDNDSKNIKSEEAKEEHPYQLTLTKNYFENDTNIFPQYNHKYHIRDFENRKIIKKISDKISIESPNNQESYINNNNYVQEKILNPSGTNVIFVPDDYPTIQSAIENASFGYTIIVRDGTYTESIIVDKPLTIQSENGYSNCAILQKSGTYIITITSDFVTISGFKIIGKDEYEKSGISIDNVNNTTISWNEFSKSYHFIRGVNTNNNTIHDNIMGSPWSYIESWAIWLKHSDNNQIYNNEIRNLDMYAVSIHLETSSNNKVNNNILRGSYCIGLISSTNNTILNNNMGSGFWAQMFIDDSHYNKIINNTFPAANIDGIILLSSNYNNISNNIFTKSGIFVYESYSNSIDNNLVNNKPLIYIEEESMRTINEDAGQIIIVNCDNITVQNQTISDTIVGIELFKTSNSTISNSNIGSHQYEAIYGVFSHDNIIYNCTFSNCYNGLGLYSCNGNEINSTYIHSIDWESMIISDSHYNKIVKNNITENFLGIELHSSNYNNICYNKLYRLSSYTANGVIRLHGSKFNNITFNNIYNQHRGIDLRDSSNNNIVMRNIVNVGGEFTVVIHESADNLICHNYLGSARPWDTSSNNMWDDGYPSGGNFWVNYNGEDKNMDGIGDTPVNIDGGGGNKDRYPLMEPYGNLRVNTNGPYFGILGIPIQFNGFACGGSLPYTWYWDLGDGSSSETQNFMYAYASIGKYTNYLSVTDDEGNTSYHLSYAWIQESNEQPEKPIIDGPAKGKAGTSIDYTFIATDPDGSTIFDYYIEWGDNSSSGWIGPFDSSNPKPVSHKWSKWGIYTIRAKARDPYGDEGPWGRLTVIMPRNKASYNVLFMRFLEQFPLLERFLSLLIN